MRNLKKLLAVILTVCVLATLMVPAFAAEKTDAEICEDLGVVLGTGSGVTAEYLATQPNRLQGAIMFLRLLGLEDEAKAFTGTDNFSDVEELNDTNKAILAYLKAHPELGYIGVGDGKFAPLEKMTAKQYYKVLLVALGYEYTVDFTWSNVFSFAAGVGLIKLIDVDTFTVEDLCKGTVEALKLAPKGGTQTLIAKLVADGSIAADKAEASGLYAIPVVPLAIEGAAALNYREIVVTFNKAVDAAKLGAAANYAVTGKTIESVVAAADNMSVTILLADGTPIAPGATAEVTVGAAILGAASKATTAAVTDGTLPSIVKAEAVGNSQIKITFSEPVRTIGGPIDYKLDGLYFAQSQLPAVAGRVITITPTNRMAAGDHKITVSSSITDYAGYGLTATREVPFTVATDTVAPTVSFTSATQTKVVVTFSEAVVKSAIEAAGITFTNGLGVSSASLAADGVTLTVNVAGVIPASGATTMTIPKASVIDVFGNSPAENLTVTFTGVADTVRPEVVSVAFAADKQNALYVTYSEDVNVDGAYILTETASNGTVSTVAGTSAAWYVDATLGVIRNKVVVTIAAGNYNPASTYSLLIKNTTDYLNPLANRMVDFVVTGLKVVDLTAPVFSDVKVYGQSMYITFDDAVDASTVGASSFAYVTSPGSTIINGLPAGVTAGLINSGKTIRITWPATGTTNGLNPLTDVLQIQVVGLKGADGNAIAALVKTIGGGWAGAGTAAVLTGAAVTGPNTVVATLDNAQNLIFNAAQALTDFELYATTGTVIKYNLINATYDSATGKITFTTYETIKNDAKIGDYTLTLKTKTATSMVDIFGQKLTANIAGFEAADKYAPTVAGISKAYTGGHTVVTVEFNENLTIGALAGFVVTADGTNVTFSATNTANTIVFTIANATDYTAKTVTVKFFKAETPLIEDASNNALADFTISK